MVSILPLHDEKILAALNEREGVDARLAYCLYDGGETTGWLLYDPIPGEALIKAVHAPDADSFDGLVRAALSKLYDLSIDRARFGPGVDRSLLVQLGFVRGGEEVTSAIGDLLYNCRHCRGDAPNSRETADEMAPEALR